MKRQRIATLKEPPGAKSPMLYYIVSLLEGSAVMACELTGAKLIEPYYGGSLYVWSSVLGTTLGGLTAGYYLGGLLSEKRRIRQILTSILLASALILFITPQISSTIMTSTIHLSVPLGSLLSCFAFIFPALLCFGMVSPIVIRIISQQLSEVGRKSGTVYAISTAGGIVMTFATGFYVIPNLGLRLSCYATAIILLIAALLSFLAQMIQGSPHEEN